MKLKSKSFEYSHDLTMFVNQNNISPDRIQAIVRSDSKVYTPFTLFWWE